MCTYISTKYTSYVTVRGDEALRLFSRYSQYTGVHRPKARGLALDPRFL